MSGYQCYLSPSIGVNSLNIYQLHRESSSISNRRTHSHLRDLAALQCSTRSIGDKTEYNYDVKIGSNLKPKGSLALVCTNHEKFSRSENIYIYVYIYMYICICICVYTYI
jgi:hypothetical protein